MKEMERYFGAIYSDNFQPSIMIKIPATFPNPDMSTIIPDTGAERTKTDGKMTHLKNNNIDD